MAEEISCPLNIDEIEVQIKDVVIRLTRRYSLAVPHEVSIFIPRAEFRHRTFADGNLTLEDEMILNSITVVHAPRHPLAGEHPPAGGPQPSVSSATASDYQAAPALKDSSLGPSIKFFYQISDKD